MESTNRINEYIKSTKNVSADTIRDRIYDIEENISNIEKEIMDKVSKNEDASALMEQVKEDGLKRHIYKYILAKREAQKASDNWNDFEEKFIVNSEQESIFNKIISKKSPTSISGGMNCN